MNYQDIEFRVENGVGWIMLNRPQAMNGLTRCLVDEAAEAVQRCERDEAVRCVVVGGNGRAFCAGADVKEFANQLQGGDVATYVRDIANDLHINILIALHRMPKVIIGMIGGVVAGGGIGLSLVGDLRIASDQARWTSAYSNIAVNPDGGSTYFLPRYLGPQRSMEFYLTNETIGAEEAKRLGLVSRVVPHDDLLIETTKLAEQIASGPTLAYGRAKRLYRDSLKNDLVTQMDMETEYIVNSVQTEDFRAGIDAFVNKSKPTFRGR